jgi:succinoglycan biosynthesis protein ExoA
MDQITHRGSDVSASKRRAKISRNSTGSVLVVIPSLNEADHVDGVITKLLANAGPLNLRIVVADGGSTDGTCAIVQRFMQRDSRVVLLNNGKHIAAAVNEAVARCGDGAEFVIRIDAHAEYPSQFCARLLEVQSETGADSVVVSMLTKGYTCFQRAAAAAQNSILGNGGSAHRNAPAGRWVDHGHHALMRIEAFRAVGGYDESFSWNEDAELDVRLRASGFRIYLAGAMSIVYYPRSSVGALFRQYFRYGRGRARNFLKHRQLLKLRQVLPLAVAPALGMLLLVPFAPAFAIPSVIWGISSLGFGLVLGLSAGDRCTAAAGVAAMAMHAGWSLGFIRELVTEGLSFSSQPARSLDRQATL